MTELIRGFGNYPAQPHLKRKLVYWPDQAGLFDELPVLSFGQGHSYGDCCLNEGGVLLDTRHLNRFHAFDREAGVLRCEPGLKLCDVMEVVAPAGWSLPVITGTQLITIGGAIANDVHGKNHHQNGSFGCHVLSFELLRSNGERLLCSKTENPDLFYATIGGMGLTGLILWAEIQLEKMPSEFLTLQTSIFSSFGEFEGLSQTAGQDFSNTVAWLDMQSRQPRGLFIQANPLDSDSAKHQKIPNQRRFSIPCFAPSFCVSPLTVKAFNALYFKAKKAKAGAEHYTPFHSPLDGIYDWNKMLGKRGFLEHQSVIPFGDHAAVMEALTGEIRASKLGSFISVLKTFGDKQSGGWMSFPMPGVTLAQDILIRGQKTFDLMKRLDAIVAEAGGRIYAAKDACMSAEHYQQFYPNFERFKSMIDPGFSSSFWRRVSV